MCACLSAYRSLCECAHVRFVNWHWNWLTKKMWWYFSEVARNRSFFNDENESRALVSGMVQTVRQTIHTFIALNCIGATCQLATLPIHFHWTTKQLLYYLRVCHIDLHKSNYYFKDQFMRIESRPSGKKVTELSIMSQISRLLWIIVT